MYMLVFRCLYVIMMMTIRSVLIMVQYIDLSICSAKGDIPPKSGIQRIASFFETIDCGYTFIIELGVEYLNAASATAAS